MKLSSVSFFLEDTSKNFKFNLVLVLKSKALYCEVKENKLSPFVTANH